MADLLALSSRFIDEGVDDGPGSTNRVTMELSEVSDGIAVVESFSHVIAFATDDGLVLADTSLAAFAPQVLASLRRWSEAHVHTVIYTHGHLDHVGGMEAVRDEAVARHQPAPEVVAHEAVPERFDRYVLTRGFNQAINERQFGGTRIGGGSAWGKDLVRPDRTFRDSLDLEVGGVAIELHHARGETDDHCWGWLPARKAVITGDFLTWVFPNAGNPQKVQRYPLEWAQTLRTIAALEPELLLPAHGLPIAGRARIERVLGDVAGALESLVNQTLELMNLGRRLDDIVNSVRLPDDLLALPWLKPVYDEPEFVIRNVWRMYGGWYDGNPAHLKPAPDAAVAAEVASLAGGAGRLAARARELAEAGDLRLAGHLAEWAAQAEPGDREVHAARAAVFMKRREAELSLMSKGIFRAAADDADLLAQG